MNVIDEKEWLTLKLTRTASCSALFFTQRGSLQFRLSLCIDKAYSRNPSSRLALYYWAAASSCPSYSPPPIDYPACPLFYQHKQTSRFSLPPPSIASCLTTSPKNTSNGAGGFRLEKRLIPWPGPWIAKKWIGVQVLKGLLFNFSSSGSSVDLYVSWRENE